MLHTSQISTKLHQLQVWNFQVCKIPQKVLCRKLSQAARSVASAAMGEAPNFKRSTTFLKNCRSLFTLETDNSLGYQKRNFSGSSWRRPSVKALTVCPWVMPYDEDRVQTAPIKILSPSGVTFGATQIFASIHWGSRHSANVQRGYQNLYPLERNSNFSLWVKTKVKLEGTCIL